VRQVGGDTGGVDHIVESELANEGGELEEQRQRLRGFASVAVFRCALGATNLSNTARGASNDCRQRQRPCRNIASCRPYQP
jgi:hypothetical protein